MIGPVEHSSNLHRRARAAYAIAASQRAALVPIECCYQCRGPDLGDARGLSVEDFNTMMRLREEATVAEREGWRLLYAARCRYAVERAYRWEDEGTTVERRTLDLVADVARRWA